MAAHIQIVNDGGALGLRGQDVVAALEVVAIVPKTAVSKKRWHIVSRLSPLVLRMAWDCSNTD
jgi:hypothetical protein